MTHLPFSVENDMAPLDNPPLSCTTSPSYISLPFLSLRPVNCPRVSRLRATPGGSKSEKYHHFFLPKVLNLISLTSLSILDPPQHPRHRAEKEKKRIATSFLIERVAPKIKLQ